MCKLVQACIILVVYRGLAYASAQQKSYSIFHICVEIVMLFTFILLYILQNEFLQSILYSYYTKAYLLPLGSYSIIIYGSSSHFFMCQSFLLLSGEAHCVQVLVCWLALLTNFGASCLVPDFYDSSRGFARLVFTLYCLNFVFRAQQ